MKKLYITGLCVLGDAFCHSLNLLPLGQLFRYVLQPLEPLDDAFDGLQNRRRRGTQQAQQP